MPGRVRWAWRILLFDPALLMCAMIGALLGSLAGLLPGLHVFNLAGAAVLLQVRGLLPIDDAALALLLVAAVAGWAMSSALPAVFLFAPDDSSVAFVLPATRTLLRGHGVQAVMWQAQGGLFGMLLLPLLLVLASVVLRPLLIVITPHLGWMLLALIAFLLMGEWPRADDANPSPWWRAVSAWLYLAAGLLTFVLSGLVGIVLTVRSPIPPEQAYQNLMPAFIGLFTVPGLLQVLGVRGRLPAQVLGVEPLPAQTLLRAGLTGMLGGAFAAVMPIVSAGIGGLLAGHATAAQGERGFIVAQGANRVVYFVGGLLLLFVPGLGVVRGGMAWMLSSMFVPSGWAMFGMALGAAALAALLGWGITRIGALWLAPRATRVSMRAVALFGLMLSVTLSALFTGAAGLGVLVVCTLIGCIPVFVGGRRLNALGILLAPATISINGWMPTVLAVLGL